MNPPPSPWAAAPRVVGHRGSPLEAPENTLPSFLAALACGARAIELDVRLTRDEEVVVLHDATLERTTGAKGRVERLDFASLRDAAPGVPTLREVLAQLPPTTLLDVELKADADNAESLPKRVADLVRRHDARDRVLATSFDPSLASAYARETGDDVGWIVPFPVTVDDVAEVRGARHVMLVEDAALPEVVQPLRAAGLGVHVWTVNDASRAKELLALGASSVITDRPRAMLATLGA